jgi:hypothetical protein
MGKRGGVPAPHLHRGTSFDLTPASVEREDRVENTTVMENLGKVQQRTKHSETFASTSTKKLLQIEIRGRLSAPILLMS